MNTFKDTALAAWRDYQAEAEAQKARDHAALTERTRAKFLKAFFGYEPERVDGSHVWGDGVELVSFREAWRVIAECQDCGRRVQSNELYNLHEIGAMLNEFKPDLEFHYNCRRSAEQPDTPEARLLVALREFIAEMQGA